MKILKALRRAKSVLFFVSVVFYSCTSFRDSPVIAVTYHSKLADTVPFSGRLLLMITEDGSKEPRFLINDSKNTGVLVGKNVHQ